MALGTGWTGTTEVDLLPSSNLLGTGTTGSSSAEDGTAEDSAARSAREGKGRSVGISREGLEDPLEVVDLGEVPTLEASAAASEVAGDREGHSFEVLRQLSPP